VPEEAIQDDEGNYNATLRAETTRSIRRPSFSKAHKINIFSQENQHILLPISASRAITTGSLRDINHCIIDMSLLSSPSLPKDVHFATLSMTNISHSLILTGSVLGATQVTNMTNSVLVTNCAQLRMHDCSNVDVYVRCGSGPIIEHCAGMRFSPLPSALLQSVSFFSFFSPPNFPSLCERFPFSSQLRQNRIVKEMLPRQKINGIECRIFSGSKRSIVRTGVFFPKRRGSRKRFGWML